MRLIHIDNYVINADAITFARYEPQVNPPALHLTIGGRAEVFRGEEAEALWAWLRLESQSEVAAPSPAPAHAAEPAAAAPARPDRERIPVTSGRQAWIAAKRPRSGKALWAWAKDRNLGNWLVDWGREHECPDRVVDWPEGIVADAHDAAQSLLAEKTQRREPARAY